MENGWNSNTDHPISPACPRCGSSNTKFCYYNNYSLTQPRYFCKGCRRYWTKGGSLRNVPVGGGCRKSRKAKSSIRQSMHVGVDSKSNGTETDPSFSETTSTSASTVIDLATVYANYLNQKPQLELTNQIQASQHLPELPNGNNTIPNTDQFSYFQNLLMNSFSSDHLPLASTGFLDNRPHLLHGDEPTNFTNGNNFTSVNSINNFTLPPLPSEDVVVSDGLFWPDSNIILHDEVFHSIHQSTKVVEPDCQNSELPNGNMVSPLSSFNLEAIFRF